jgi:hypothetical protein
MWTRKRKVAVTILIIFLAGPVGLYVVSNLFPRLGAKGADAARRVLGNERVAHLEAMAFGMKDAVNRGAYAVGIKHVRAPWGRGAVPTSGLPSAHAAALPPDPAPEPEATQWRPHDLEPLGSLTGEGEWSDYLRDDAGHVVARRTFLQPDAKRPYAVVAVVAFDVQRIRLHYVLGTQEPSVPGGPHGTGRIAADDRRANVLLCAFNGGFKATHGHFGAMADGTVAIPPKPGLAAVAIQRDGKIRLGQWGRDVTESPDVVAWRENSRLIIDGGQITELALQNRVRDWGGTVDGKVVTWRSAIGLSQDGRTLYYFAGPGLSMPALARAMQHAGVWEGMLLDINAYWVHFTAFHTHNGKWKAVPLLPDGMNDGVDRYLRTSERDFFYVTLASPAPAKPAPHVAAPPARTRVH